MARARHKVEQLRHRVQEIQDLGHEEKKEGFREVPEDGDHGEGHPGEVAEGVPGEHLAGEPVVLEEGQAGAQVGKEEVQREVVMVLQGATTSSKVEGRDAKGDDDGLADFQSVDARQDVDGVCAEDCEHADVYVVEDSQVDYCA